VLSTLPDIIVTKLIICVWKGDIFILSFQNTEYYLIPIIEIVPIILWVNIDYNTLLKKPSPTISTNFLSSVCETFLSYAFSVTPSSINIEKFIDTKPNKITDLHNSMSHSSLINLNINATTSGPKDIANIKSEVEKTNNCVRFFSVLLLAIIVEINGINGALTTPRMAWLIYIFCLLSYY